jgi:FAD/FMN-containing dehydrogenase/Fe-S oxidoreductase
MQQDGFRFREIPYNYTSLSDKEIILKYFDEKTWADINLLRSQRVTGRSAKLIYEIIGDIFIIERNPYLYEDFLTNKNKFLSLKKIHKQRFESVVAHSENNELVFDLVRKTKLLNETFFKSFAKTRNLRNQLMINLTGTTSLKNICFTPFHRVSHATDATDWRVEYPVAIVYPDAASEIPRLIRKIKELGLTIIPRGGGTGLTGGSVPVQNNTVVINTEKLNKIGEIRTLQENGNSIPIIEVEAGVVTDDVIEYCDERNYIFATDPTSSWASTIGGNIAENAGGKKCVMWGTAIDNIYSFTLVDPEGSLITVKRVDHPYRKIKENDIVEFEVVKKRKKKELSHSKIFLQGTEIRKRGLGKDITNKALNGLPGLQKEGGDGLIISAQFVLYKPFRFKNTLCLEFFGTNMVNASRAIVHINDHFENDEFVYLTALEHFDEKYVTAINYRNKSTRYEIPKAVLLIDIESDSKNELQEASSKVLELIKQYEAEGFLADSAKDQKNFWNDRKHLGAIAQHTNAFKLNEDIVIPLNKLPEFADFIELLNFEKKILNSINAITKIENYLTELSIQTTVEYPHDRLVSYLIRIKKIKGEYNFYQSNLKSEVIAKQFENEYSFLRKLQNGEVVIDFEEEIKKHYRQTFSGYENILTELEKITKGELGRKVIIATHMHAGDGNVHVNIPVHSSDYLMMQEADEAASIIMKKAVELGGVVSGEHGIGLTKLKFIESEILDKYNSYKSTADPDNIFNPGKLDVAFPYFKVYTPSFNLLEREAIILESTDLEKLSTSIAKCVRCGKCKSVCNTHYTNGNMFYNPRNKILAVGLITEAVLFSAQTMDMKSFKQFKKLREIADNCTMCHKCKVPCPVKIDFGDVSLQMREHLQYRKKTSLKLFTNMALFYLSRKKYYINTILRILILNLGYGAQRSVSFLYKPISKFTSGWLPRIVQLIKTPFPRSGSKSIREVFKLKDVNAFYCFEKPQTDYSKSVLYFPGCGSERMFSEISFAVISLLYQSGIRIIIPNEYLCCGYPFLANGKKEKAEIKSYENRVLFHRISDVASYMNIEAVIVSCGTCFEMIQKYEIENIFNGAELIDINEYLFQNKLFTTNTINGNEIIYHEPCHTPLKKYGYSKTIEYMHNSTPVESNNCCGEAGTLALSRPDISSILRDRKNNNVSKHNGKGGVEILTSCPSCVLGLSKLGNGHKVVGKSLAVHNAEVFLGKNWKKDFIKNVKKNGIEKILL